MTCGTVKAKPKLKEKQVALPVNAKHCFKVLIDFEFSFDVD